MSIEQHVDDICRGLRFLHPYAEPLVWTAKQRAIVAKGIQAALDEVEQSRLPGTPLSTEELRTIAERINKYLKEYNLHTTEYTSKDVSKTIMYLVRGAQLATQDTGRLMEHIYYLEGLLADAGKDGTLDMYKKGYKAGCKDHKELIGLLKEFEWREIPFKFCYVCQSRDEHRPDCKLVKLLKEDTQHAQT